MPTDTKATAVLQLSTARPHSLDDLLQGFTLGWSIDCLYIVIFLGNSRLSVPFGYQNGYAPPVVSPVVSMRAERGENHLKCPLGRFEQIQDLHLHGWMQEIEWLVKN